MDNGGSVPDPSRPFPLSGKRWLALAAPVGLFLLNAYICRELFHIGFLNNMDSNEGVFVAISRFFREHGPNAQWFPFFNCGMPLENAYQPLLPMLAAVAGWISGGDLERCFHFVLAAIYCAGPLTLFWFVRDWSGSLSVATVTGLLYSITSLAEVFIPILRVNTQGHWGPLRLYNLVHYAEDPHNLALTLFPVALLFLRRMIVRPTVASFIGGVLFCGAVVGSNAFGAFDLLIGGICIVLAARRGAGVLVTVGITAYLWISPWLPPSLMMLIGRDQWSSRGYFSGNAKTRVLIVLLLAVFATIWVATRRLPPFERFTLLLLPWMTAFPVVYFFTGISLVPQGNRYQLEMEMALCLVLGSFWGWFARYAGTSGKILLVTLTLALTIRQTKIFRHYAHDLIQPVALQKTIEYKTSRWLDQNLRGQRAMVSGDTAFLYNILSDNPQLGGGHEPQVPNWMDRVAVYTIFTGDGAGSRDGEISLFWLKAFGVQAISVPGDQSREHYHPIAHPRKFDGMLPVLWHDEDDTIFAVPQRSKSLAHVMPREAIVARQPVHGLDTDPVRPYVAALEDPALPPATLSWSGNSAFSVQAALNKNQVVSVQITWMPGWEARVDGHSVPVRGDQLGLMVVEPDCSGNCTIDVHRGTTAESWFCRLSSGFVTAGLLALLCVPLVGDYRSRMAKRAVLSQ